MCCIKRQIVKLIEEYVGVAVKYKIYLIEGNYFRESLTN